MQNFCCDHRNLDSVNQPLYFLEWIVPLDRQWGGGGQGAVNKVRKYILLARHKLYEPYLTFFTLVRIHIYMIAKKKIQKPIYSKK